MKSVQVIPVMHNADDRRCLSHILDEDRATNAQRFEAEFYSKSEAPERLPHRCTCFELTDMRQAKFIQLLSNPEFATLIKSFVVASKLEGAVSFCVRLLLAFSRWNSIMLTDKLKRGVHICTRLYLNLLPFLHKAANRPPSESSKDLQIAVTPQ
jgi:hypothetical protein